MSAPASETTLPPEIQSWIDRGLAVRSDTEGDPYAGRCGAKGRNHRGEAFCKNLAGRATEHRGIGRCDVHEGVEEGLGLWIGELDPARRRAIVGGDQNGSAGTHQAHGLATLSVDEVFAKYLDDDERAIYASDETPAKVLDRMVRLRQIALARVNQTLHAERMRFGAVGQRPPAEVVMGWEGLADKVTGTIARLMEAKAKFTAIDAADKHRAGIMDLLSTLSADELAKIENDPSLLALYHAAPPSF